MQKFCKNCNSKSSDVLDTIKHMCKTLSPLKKMPSAQITPFVWRDRDHWHLKNDILWRYYNLFNI